MVISSCIPTVAAIPFCSSGCSTPPEALEEIVDGGLIGWARNRHVQSEAMMHNDNSTMQHDVLPDKLFITCEFNSGENLKIALIYTVEVLAGLRGMPENVHPWVQRTFTAQIQVNFEILVALYNSKQMDLFATRDGSEFYAFPISVLPSLIPYNLQCVSFHRFFDFTDFAPVQGSSYCTAGTRYTVHSKTPFFDVLDGSCYCDPAKSLLGLYGNFFFRRHLL